MKGCPKYGTIVHSMMNSKRNDATRTMMALMTTIDYYTHLINAVESKRPDIDLSLEKEYLEVAEKMYEKLHKQLMEFPCI